MEFNEKIQESKTKLETETALLTEAKEKYNHWKMTLADKRVFVKTLKKKVDNLEKKKSNTLNTKNKLIQDEKENKLRDLEKEIKNLQKQKSKIEKALDKELSKL